MSNHRRRNQRQPRTSRRSCDRRPRGIDRDLIELQRLAMLGQLFAEGAHEINGLLELACSYLQLQVQGGASPEESEGHLQTIFDLAMIARGAALTVLEFSSPVPGPTTCAIETVLRLFERRLAGNAKVTLWGTESLAPVAMPAGQFQLVLANIVRNALDAVESVGGGQIRLTAAQAPGWLTLEVWNSGPPIPGHIMNRLFHQRVSTKPRGRNSGLGLSISNHLVRSARGRLDAWNDPHCGVTFRLCLPIVPQKLQTEFEETLTLPSPGVPGEGTTTNDSYSCASAKSSLAGREILLVDGCEPVRNAVRVLLRGMSGATVHTCACGEQALELVGSSRPFDAILLDLHLPRLSSEETFNRLPLPIRNRVVFLTHDGRRRSTAGPLAVSAQPTLHKPVRYAALIEAIASVSAT